MRIPSSRTTYLRGKTLQDSFVLACDASLALCQPALAAVFAQLAGHTLLNGCRAADHAAVYFQDASNAPHKHSSAAASSGSAPPSSSAKGEFESAVSKSLAGAAHVRGTSAVLPAIRIGLLLFYTGHLDLADEIFVFLLSSGPPTPAGQHPPGHVLFARDYSARSTKYREVMSTYAELGVDPHQLLLCLEACMSMEPGRGEADVEAAIELCLEGAGPAALMHTATMRRAGQLGAISSLADQCKLRLDFSRRLPICLQYGVGHAWSELKDVMQSAKLQQQENARKLAAASGRTATSGAGHHELSNKFVEPATSRPECARSADKDNSSRAADENQKATPATTDDIDDLLALALDDLGIESETPATGAATGFSNKTASRKTPDGFEVLPCLQSLGSRPAFGSPLGNHEHQIVDMTGEPGDGGWGHGGTAVYSCCKWLCPWQDNPI